MPIPEWRLPPVIIGGVLFAIGLIWFGFSGYKASISIWAPIISGLFSGFGIVRSPTSATQEDANDPAH